MAGVRRGGATEEEVVVLLTVVRLERLVLWAVLEFGADGERRRSIEPGEGEGPDNHRVEGDETAGE